MGAKQSSQDDGRENLEALKEEIERLRKALSSEEEEEKKKKTKEEDKRRHRRRQKKRKKEEGGQKKKALVFATDAQSYCVRY